ncbi:hypothetical protein CWI38_1330p0020 [Hamiltosporidium tvaerminnensis]|uniref:Tc1-like transposase DDE domain-containing protein n=2 Tax=Hamiltosporidium TaxID=1176354 RepID=A0A4Q9LRJ0_9MICR|nr:hypothetical protein CWI38_1330p0020 [Hamiltosporidium tvaerminnensis]
MYRLNPQKVIDIVKRCLKIDLVFVEKNGGDGVDSECTKTLYDKGRNMKGESAYLSVTAARSRNISVVAAMNKYSMIYYKIHERAGNREDFKLSIKYIYESCQRQGISTPNFVIDNARIHHYLGSNDYE